MHRCLGAVERGGGHVEFRKLWAPRVGSAAGSARHWWGAGPLGARMEPYILITIPQSEINHSYPDQAGVSPLSEE